MIGEEDKMKVVLEHGGEQEKIKNNVTCRGDTNKDVIVSSLFDEPKDKRDRPEEETIRI